MKIIRKALRMCIPVVYTLFLITGTANAALLGDGDFNASADSAALRANEGVGNWYESRGTNPLKLMLYSNPSPPGLYGNTTQMALLKGAQTGSGDGTTYLTQDFSSALTGRCRVSFDILIENVFNRGSGLDAAGFIFVGNDLNATGGPNNAGTERFVYLGFYDPDGGSSGQHLQLRANDANVNVTSADALSYNTWYTITLDIDVANGRYDVTVDDTNGSATLITKANIAANANLSSLTALSFMVGSGGTTNIDFGNGTFYVDNVSAVPIPGAVWLLGSGLLGLVAIRRRMKK